MRLDGEGVTLVVGIGDGAEAFLACRVPDLQFDVLVVAGDCLEAEVHSDGRHVVLVELVVGESQEQAALAYG